MAKVKLQRDRADALVEDAIAHPIMRANPGQIRAYVRKNVKDLASAREVIEDLAVLVASLSKRLPRG